MLTLSTLSVPALSAAFTPVMSTVGGLLLGAVTAGNLAANGKITGISGTVGNGVAKAPLAPGWRQSFAGGLLLGGAGVGVAAPEMFGEVVAATGGTPASTAALLAGGALVGFGTRMGCGCTSGHGLSGLPRWSARSLAAVSSFMLTGGLTASAITANEQLSAAFRRAGAAAAEAGEVAASNADLVASTVPGGPMLAAAIGTGLVGHTLVRSIVSGPPSSDADPVESQPPSVAVAASSALFGATFSLGLGMAGMLDTTKVLAFLDLATTTWDPSLALVMGGGVAVGLGAFPFISGRAKQTAEPPLSPEDCGCDLPTAEADAPAPEVAPSTSGQFPLFGSKLDLPTATVINAPLVIGSALFGIGWGMAGLCPGPAMAALGQGSADFWLYGASMLAGMRLHDVAWKK